MLEVVVIVNTRAVATDEVVMVMFIVMRTEMVVMMMNRCIGDDR